MLQHNQQKDQVMNWSVLILCGAVAMREAEKLLKEESVFCQSSCQIKGQIHWQLSCSAPFVLFSATLLKVKLNCSSSCICRFHVVGLFDVIFTLTVFAQWCASRTVMKTAAWWIGKWHRWEWNLRKQHKWLFSFHLTFKDPSSSSFAGVVLTCVLTVFEWRWLDLEESVLSHVVSNQHWA